ncbi:MAG: dihydropteroate synthase [Acidimicrobiia bacterium]|nr:dihydropteroate synthase [Acidimicrobiia bacterium]
MTTSPEIGLQAGAHTIDFSGGRVHLMGVLNLSPESKNTPTVASNLEEALRIADAHRRNGATIIDVGAQSSHFENVELNPDEEVARLAGPVQRLVQEGFLVSVDTWKPEVARAAIELGAVIINDTGGLRQAEMIEVVAGGNVASVVMFLEGDSPLAVGSIDLDQSLVAGMVDRLGLRLRQLAGSGVTNVVVDPGIGISYRADRSRYTLHQLDVIRQLDRLHALGKPVLLPVPRKAELAPTLALATLALEYGADILRVHDTEAVAEIARLMGRME